MPPLGARGFNATRGGTIVQNITPVDRTESFIKIENTIENEIMTVGAFMEDTIMEDIIIKDFIMTGLIMEDFITKDTIIENIIVGDTITEHTIIENTTIKDITPEDTIIEVIILGDTTTENITSENIMNILLRMIATIWAGYSLSQVGHLDSPLAAYFDQSSVKS
jgi:hypothetical protein